MGIHGSDLEHFGWCKFIGRYLLQRHVQQHGATVQNGPHPLSVLPVLRPRTTGLNGRYVPPLVPQTAKGIGRPKDIRLVLQPQVLLKVKLRHNLPDVRALLRAGDVLEGAPLAPLAIHHEHVKGAIFVPQSLHDLRERQQQSFVNGIVLGRVRAAHVGSRGLQTKLVKGNTGRQISGVVLGGVECMHLAAKLLRDLAFPLGTRVNSK